jgi:hypothetical protein
VIHPQTRQNVVDLIEAAVDRELNGLHVVSPRVTYGIVVVHALTPS